MSAGEAGLAAPAGQAASGGFDGLRPSVPAAPERPAGALSRSLLIFRLVQNQI